MQKNTWFIVNCEKTNSDMIYLLDKPKYCFSIGKSLIYPDALWV